MNYISVFSGIEAASVAWESLGWIPLAFCEIDEFPSAVLAQRFPEIPNLGDITKVDWSEYAGKTDLVVGGSPCQSFSVAGNRTGLEGASGLMWEYVRCVREVRPRWFVWENVPGALSSTKGEDFRCLLESMDDLGYGLAWRVLDAQFFGVAQRRRRVFLVGSLGDRRSADVLFEPESLCRDSPSSREKRKELTKGTEIRTRDCCWQIAGNIINRQPQHGGNQLGIRDPGIEGAFTLTATDRHAAVCLPFDTAQITSPQNGSNPKWDDPCHSLCATGCAPTICLSGDNSNAAIDVDKSGTLTAHDAKGAPSVLYDGCVRRLTPRECERLQGFPDDWTNIAWRDGFAPNTKRYKAIGNSMAVPVMKWIGERIASVERMQKG